MDNRGEDMRGDASSDCSKAPQVETGVMHLDIAFHIFSACDFGNA